MKNIKRVIFLVISLFMVVGVGSQVNATQLVNKNLGYYTSNYTLQTLVESSSVIRTTTSSSNNEITEGQEYSCNYRSQIDGAYLKIVKYEDEWKVTYPNGDVKKIATDKVGSNLFPSENCEDIFYSGEENVIKRVVENEHYTNIYVSQYCGKYEDLEQYCDEGTCKITKVPCGSESETNQYGDCPDELAPVILFLKKVIINTLQIFVPIILIIMATIDLVKAVMANDDKMMKDSASKIVKRILTAVLMFFVTTIVVIVIDMFAKTDVGEQSDWKDCWQELN